MQNALEKIILPSLLNAKVPDALKDFISWTLDTGLPILKKSNIKGLENIKKYDIDRPKLESFLNSYVDKTGLVTEAKLKTFRDGRMGLPAAMKKEFEAFGKAYAASNILQVGFLYNSFNSKSKAALASIKPFMQSSGINNQNKLIEAISGLLVWAIQNYSTSSSTSNNANATSDSTGSKSNRPLSNDFNISTPLLVGGIVGSVLLVGGGLYLALKSPKAKKKKKSNT